MLSTSLMVLVLNYLAFALMACAMQRHRQNIAGGDQPVLSVIRQWWLRGTGGVLLLLALWLAIHCQGASMGSLLWVLLLSCAALLVSFTLSGLPGSLSWLLRGVRYWTE